MNHYDGPAFYRRFISNSRKNKLKNNKKQPQNQISQITHSDRVRSKFQRDFKNDNRNNNRVMQMTRAFTPTHDFRRKSNVVDRKERKVNAFYNRLIDELSKNSNECILLENSVKSEYNPTLNYRIEDVKKSNEVDNSSKADNNVVNDNVDINDSSKADSSINHLSRQKAVSEDNEKPSSSNSSRSSEAENNNLEDKKINNVPQSSANLTHDRIKDSYSDSKDTFNVVSDNPNPVSDAKQSEEGEKETSKSVKNYLSENSVNKDNEKEKVEEINDENNNALGHSLNDIMDNEDHQKQRISLFDKPSRVADNHVDNKYQFPQFTLLNKAQPEDDSKLDDWILHQSDVLDRTLKAFNVDGEVVDWTNGPTVTRFQVKLKLGVKVSRITNLNDDLKMALAAKDIRIEAPIPGRRTVGVEIPNPKPRPVMLSEVLESKEFKNAKSPLTTALGVDLSGKPQVTDIRKMPHGLIAGATGSGKSVFINSILISLLYKATPADLRLILIDPKAVEMAPYDGIPHLLAPVISEPNEAAAALKWTVKEMNQRYERLAASGSRNIEQYNQQAIDHHQPNLKLPYIVVVIDELADLMMVASTEVQDYIVRITQKARAAGIHLIVATQRPSVDIITGTIKNNIPTRVAFMVSSQVDSRTIIDTAGAERLLGKGDMLYLGNGKSQAIRLQGTYVANDEIERVTNEVKKQGTPRYAFNPKALLKRVDQQEKQDSLLPQVLKYISNEKHVSTSKLQRVFSIGYNRAATLIDDLEKHGYVSGQHGSKPREVYLTKEDFKKLNL